MVVDPPRQVRDACYRRKSRTLLPFPPEGLSEPALIDEALRMLGDPTPIVGGRWRYRSVGPPTEVKYDLFWLGYRATREWVEPTW